MTESMIAVSQECGTFELFNFTNIIVSEDWQLDEPRNGFYFDLKYDTLTAMNTGYISFYLVNESNDTITQKDYYEWSRSFPTTSEETVRYTMILDTSYTELPLDFSGYLLTANPQCQIPISLSKNESEEILPKELTVFPNPTQGQLFIEQNFNELSLYDLHGKLVLKKLNASSIDLSRLSSGIYFLRAINKGTYHFSKIVKK